MAVVDGEMKLIPQLKKIFPDHEIKIQFAGGKIYLMIGKWKSTKAKDYVGVWTDERGNIKHWKFIEWVIVASSKTESGLMREARRYLKISKMTMEQYLKSSEFLNLNLERLLRP